MAVDAGDDRADRRQIDVVVGVHAGHVGRPERVVAMRAGGERGLDEILSGCSARARVKPGRLGRGFFLPGSGRFGFWPFDGGRLELSGVLLGTASLASNSANPRGQCRGLLRLRFDQARNLLRLRLDQRDQVIAGKAKEGSAVHAWS